jgi:glycosyltransferase involved in cell wall biosynthesis
VVSQSDELQVESTNLLGEREALRVPNAPYFSIVMPIYNRATLVRRALDSCLAQSFCDFEIVVVDDGSLDQSYEVVAAYRDPRIRLFRHEINRGVCPARNTAVWKSVGTWVICLDSDNELLPGGLEAMYQRSSAAAPGVGNVRFMCRFDSGELSPYPPFKGDVLDYRGYVRWLANPSGSRHEATICLRRSGFESVSFPENRALEALFHFEFARLFLTWDCPDVVSLYHQDASNSLCFSFSGARLLESAPDQAAMHVRLLRNHGDALRECAPNVFATELRSAAMFLLLSGKRREGMAYSLRFLRKRLISPVMAATFLFGLCGPWALVFLKWLSWKIRRLRA